MFFKKISSKWQPQHYFLFQSDLIFNKKGGLTTEMMCTDWRDLWVAGGGRQLKKYLMQ
jgi:hypothetical protein